MKNVSSKILILILIFQTANSYAEQQAPDRALQPEQRVLGSSGLLYATEFKTQGQLKGLRFDIISIDTRDRKKCRKVQHRLRQSASKETRINIRDICIMRSDAPIISIAQVQPYERLAGDGRSQFKIMTPRLNNTQKNLARETAVFGVDGAAMFGFLWMLPESVTKWDKSAPLSRLGENYVDNIKAGPVVDNDAWAINFIGHPLSGAAYYVVGRYAGLSRWQAFGYSAAMSTFFWEYGIEAFAEVPSIQDLILTPVVGAVVGEYLYQLDKKLSQNDGVFLGSKRLGHLARWVLNPAGRLSQKINNTLHGRFIVDSNVLFETGTRWGQSDRYFRSNDVPDGSYGMIKFKFLF